MQARTTKYHKPTKQQYDNSPIKKQKIIKEGFHSADKLSKSANIPNPEIILPDRNAGKDPKVEMLNPQIKRKEAILKKFTHRAEQPRKKLIMQDMNDSMIMSEITYS